MTSRSSTRSGQQRPRFPSTTTSFSTSSFAMGFATRSSAVRSASTSRIVDRRLERLRDQLEDAVAVPSLPGCGLRGARAGRASARPEAAESGPSLTTAARAARPKHSGPPPRASPQARDPGGAIALFAAAATAGAFYAARGKGVHDPTSVHSTSHSTEQRLREPSVAIAWSPSADASGYSVSWSPEPETPDKSVDLPGRGDGHDRPPEAGDELVQSPHARQERPLDEHRPPRPISDFPGHRRPADDDLRRAAQVRHRHRRPSSSSRTKRARCSSAASTARSSRRAPRRRRTPGSPGQALLPRTRGRRRRQHRPDARATRMGGRRESSERRSSPGAGRFLAG